MKLIRLGCGVHRYSSYSRMQHAPTSAGLALRSAGYGTGGERQLPSHFLLTVSAAMSAPR
eukprot:COSAG01_NODE_3147_length_6515_cov_3.711347_10_plen_60_part_00